MSEIDTSGLQTRAIEAVNQHARLAQAINDSLCSFGELGVVYPALERPT
jgi:hypothetical protein